MKKYWRWSVYLILFFLFVIFFESETVFAHRMVVEPIEDGVVYVRYDDGTPASAAYVTAYDETGDVLVEGQVDEEGYFYYDHDEEIDRFVADDGLGHRSASKDKMESPHILEKIPLVIRALLGTGVVVFIAAIFSFRNK
ncbi:hypothetical protein [Oceanobacillus halotolerans]|uniref:hypothetical protein n=1 Tax=Oceanobacillus halotolerans TaxID=2663380 RepID=UPI0013DB5E1E|nr:hypothetical protein [Oceanobacillus halotolerans]